MCWVNAVESGNQEYGREGQCCGLACYAAAYASCSTSNPATYWDEGKAAEDGSNVWAQCHPGGRHEDAPGLGLAQAWQLYPFWK